MDNQEVESWEVKSGDIVLSYNHSDQTYTMKHLVTKEEKTVGYDVVQNFVNVRCGDLSHPQTKEQLLGFLIIQR